MRRLWRSKKASISILILLIFLLIAWMGALTFTVMETEQLQIIDVNFNGYGGAGSTIDIHVRNAGSATVIVTAAKVNDTIISVTDIIIDPGESHEVTGISYSWISGTAYNIAVVTNTGATFTYRAISPSL